jgi:hypothetical protein
MRVELHCFWTVLAFAFFFFYYLCLLLWSWPIPYIGLLVGIVPFDVVLRLLSGS